MLVDEEGVFRELRRNYVASELYVGFIYGDVLFVGERVDEDGEMDFCSIEPDTLNYLQKVLEFMGDRYKDAMAAGR